MTKKIKLKISARLLKKRFRKQTTETKKQCRFCGDDKQILHIDYKNALFLRSFLTERGKILPSRISGTCCKHQRALSLAIRKSRIMALVSYCAPQY
jgi:small subunit ribosomal protein S18